MGTYKSEASINKILAQLQIANAAVEVDAEENEESFEELLRHALESENEAVKIYIQLKEKAEALGSTILVKAFDELKKDEQEHIGNLNYLVKILCTSAVEKEQEGEVEEIKIQADTTEEE